MLLEGHSTNHEFSLFLFSMKIRFYGLVEPKPIIRSVTVDSFVDQLDEDPGSRVTTELNSINDVPADFIFFGGDELTEERARNIQKARADGKDCMQRLDGTWPKNEDWHAIRIAYKVRKVI